MSLSSQSVYTVGGPMIELHSCGLVKSCSMPRPVESASLFPDRGKFSAGGDYIWVHLFDFYSSYEIGESGLNTYRRMIRTYELQVQDLREQNSLLKTLLQRNIFDEPKLEVARWELVKMHMAPIAKRLMLGLNPKKNRPFPKEEHIKEAILEAFDTSASDTVTRKIFDRVWVESLRKKVKKVISDRRGKFSSTARHHLWRYLGVPKPIFGTAEEIEEWKLTLVPYAQGNRWRWNGHDPFGSEALCNTIAFVKFGRRYSPSEPLKLTAKQLAWFAYVLHLAVDGDRNMKESEMRLHRKEISAMKKFILESRDLLTKVELMDS